MDWHSAALVALAVSGAPIVWRTLRHAWRGHFATDIVASLAIVTALALRQPLAGLVIVLMQTGGEFLERYAARRASRALDELEDARPQVAHRLNHGLVADVSADEVAAGDVLLVRPGELIPADCVVTSGESTVDVSRITGESLPLEVRPGTSLFSGTANGDRPLTVRATAAAAESQYSRIVALVRSAQESKAPLQRLADRYAVWFTPLTITICLLTYAATQDWPRVLAVLVVATPCPLILATPVAMVGGISHAARHGIIVRHGGALEALAGVTVAVFDKTGTLTIGVPAVSRVIASHGWDPVGVLRLAAAVEEGSGHLLARSIVAEARARNGGTPEATSVVETPGRGVVGRVGDHRVLVGSRSFVVEKGVSDESLLTPMEGDRGVLRAFVVADASPIGVIEFADQVRSDSGATIERLKRLGIDRTMLLSGDQPAYVSSVAAALGITDARGNLLPAEKVEVVAQLEDAGQRVLMVGDGVNDAPALSRASVGVALAAHGRGIASEAADVILLDDELSDVAEAVEIGHKTMRVARQSIVIGLGLSAIAMLFAAFGMISPIAGAALQEGIDVAVILNALRTSR